MAFTRSIFFTGLCLLAGLTSGRAEEPMEGTFLASRACPALLSIRKQTNPGMVSTGAGVSYRLIAANQKQVTHYRIVVPDAQPPERWVEASCGSITAAGATAPSAPAAPLPPAAKPRAGEAAYVLALSWQPAFCEGNRAKPECRAQGGNAASLSLHGLWPQPSTKAYCNVDQAVREASERGRWRDIPAPQLSMATKAGLDAVMPGSKSLLERHEWAKHGTCYPADADTYFKDAVRLVNAVNATPVTNLFTQNIGRNVTTAQIRAAFDKAFGPGAGQRVRVACKDAGDRRLISELTLGLRGDIPGGTPIADLIMASPATDAGCPGGIVDPAGPQ